jgi:cyclopropane-fatty-acyl-phospholipid synthase
MPSPVRPSATTDASTVNQQNTEHSSVTSFPVGKLDHLGMSIANLQRHGFEVHNVEAWREHYARTCRLWHDQVVSAA